MLDAATIKFLKDLNKNNNKAWFDKHRSIYDTARANFSDLTDEVIKSIATFDSPIGNFSAKECMFRINRDVRFSKDKTPYKTNMSAYFNQGGKKSNGAGYYMHIEPGKSFVAGGLWQPEPAVLAKIRQELDYSFDDWKKILNNTGFKKAFVAGIDNTDILQRPPKGYEETNPAIDFLKMKSFVVRAPLADTLIQSKDLVKEIAKIFKAMKPFIDFLNHAAAE